MFCKIYVYDIQSSGHYFICEILMVFNLLLLCESVCNRFCVCLMYVI